MNEQTKDRLVAQINDLYFMWRQTYLRQFPNNYITVKRTITDYQLREHVEQKKTYGVKLGDGGLTKFLAFDVDFKDDLETAREVTSDLVKTLHDFYGIALDDIHIDFSGNKGYHVTLFFDKYIQDYSLLPLYYETLERIGRNEHEVEFRASSKYGMKLPLGINQQTKAFMCFCEYDYLTEQVTHLDENASYEYFLQIQRINLSDFRELVLDDFKEVRQAGIKPQVKPKDTILSENEANDWQEVLSELNFNGKSIDELEKELKLVISSKHLTFKSSRHRVTLLLAIFFKEQGCEQDDTVSFINAIMLNTYDNYRHLISKETTKEFMLNEAVRLTKITYERDYKFTSKRKAVRIHKQEIDVILGLKELQLKKLALSMLVHAKRHTSNKKSLAEQDFYMTYEQMERMGNTGTRSRLIKYQKQLDSLGLVYKTSTNKLDMTRTKDMKQPLSFPSRYKVLFSDEKLHIDSGLLLLSDDEIDLGRVVASFYDKGTVRDLVPRKQFENTFRKAYE